MIPATETIVIDDGEVEERFVRASGPGGQNVNKEATAVELRFDVNRSSLPGDIKDRLIGLAGRSVTSDGVLIVVSRVHRSQAQNREAAHDRLLALLQRAAKPPKIRRPTKPRATEREKRLASKKLRGAVKQFRRPGRPGGD